jgi:hypothetical protein
MKFFGTCEGNGRVRARAIQSIQLPPTSQLPPNTSVETRETYHSVAGSDVLWSLRVSGAAVSPSLSLSVPVPETHMSSSSTGGFYVSWGRGAFSCFVVGEIKGGSP